MTEVDEWKLAKNNVSIRWGDALKEKKMNSELMGMLDEGKYNNYMTKYYYYIFFFK